MPVFVLRPLPGPAGRGSEFPMDATEPFHLLKAL